MAFRSNRTYFFHEIERNGVAEHKYCVVRKREPGLGKFYLIASFFFLS